MDSVPLIPTSKKPENHDVSSLIREVFQDIIGEPQFSKNVAENTQKYHLENQCLKKTGKTVTAVYDETKLSMEDIGFVEEKLMVGHGGALKTEDVIAKDDILTECLKLKRRGIFEDLDANKVEKYGLLQKADLLPTKPERSIDFRINSNCHLCPPPCPTRSTALDMYPIKLENNERKRKLPVRRLKRHKQPEPILKIDPQTIILDDNKTKKRNVIFTAEPEVVIFHEYEKGITYEKTFKLRNVSKVTQSFLPRMLPKTSFFKVELQAGTTRVAPGVSIVFSVKYLTDIYKDVDETMIFNTYTGADVAVKFKSHRKPPLLSAYIVKSEHHFLEKCPITVGVNLFDDERTIALNSTIDCGSCLLGNQLNITIVLMNRGKIGRFFILSEEDWFVYNTSAINADLTLKLKGFEMYPVYFKMDTDECVTVTLKFRPSYYGLAVEKLFLLCDNNTYEELEIIGDGVLFEKNHIVLDIIDKDQNMINMDAESKYLIDFGKCIPYQTYVRNITIHNNSIVNLRYKWELNERTCYTSSTKLEKMNPAWISISNMSDVLPSESTTDFQVTLCCNSKKVGYYSLVATLYVLDIPDQCLSTNNTFYVMETNHKSQRDHCHDKVLNIYAGEIELMCEVTSVEVVLEPNQLIIPFTLKSNAIFEQKVQVYSPNKETLNCEWILSDAECVRVSPTSFLLPPETVFICDVTVRMNVHEDYQEQLIFKANGGWFTTVFNVRAKLLRPKAEFSESLLNFGKVPQGKEIDGKTFFIRNLGPHAIWWTVSEFSYDFEMKAIMELDVTKHLSCAEGIMCGNDSCEIMYTINNVAPHHHRWFSFLILYSSYPTTEAMDSLCLVTYEVIQPEIVIHSQTSSQPILYPGKMLYVGCKTYYKLCLHNLGRLCTSFMWKKPTGKHHKCLKIRISPRRGIIQAGKCAHIMVKITPVETGILDDIHVPCLVGYINKCVWLTILCAVDNIHINVCIPDSRGQYQKVFWPPTIIDGSSIALSIAEEFKSELEQEDPISFTSSFSKTTAEFSCGASQEYEVEENYQNCNFDFNTETSLTSEETAKSMSPTTSSTVPLKDYFQPDLVLQEYVLEFRNIPLRKPVKKTIIIENLTPIVGKFDLELANFSEVQQEEDERKVVMDEILDNLKIKKTDKWEKRINTKFGIVVRAKPIKGILASYCSVEVDIWVYANTWGAYVEEIVIEVNDILPFCFNLLIEIIGVPIEFPIALNSINSDPIIRFGNLPYVCDPLQRRLKITNYGCIPLHLAWHIFIPSGNSVNDPFNVFIDALPLKTYDPEMDVMKLMITSKCYGKENWKYFVVEPRTLTINPKSTETIAVTLIPRRYCSKARKTEIQAYLLSFLHLSEEFLYQPNVYSRQADVRVAPLKIQLQATLELSLLQLELFRGDVQITAYANDIIEAEEVRYTMRLVFRNGSTAPVTVFMHSAIPFRVISLRTAQTNTDNGAYAATVQPGECVEVLVECMVDAEQVLQYSDMLYNDKTTVFPETANFKDLSISVIRCLNIHQRGLEQQVTALELVLYYPRFGISHNSINFGTVFVGKTKKMLLDLSNSTGARLPYHVYQQSTSGVIIVRPTAGILPKASSTVPSTVTLSLYFIPSECGIYEEEIRILTNIPLCCHTVMLKGDASNNEKYYVEGI